MDPEVLAALLALILGGDFSSLSDEDLAAHEAALLDEFDAQRPNARGPEALAALGQIADAVDALRSEAGVRIDAAVAEAEQVAAIEARLRPAGEPEAEADPEPVEEPAAEPVEAEAPAEEPAPTTPEPVLVASTPAAPTPTPAPTPVRRVSLASLRSDPPPANAPRSMVRLSNGQAYSRSGMAQAMIDADRYSEASRIGARFRMPIVHVDRDVAPGTMLNVGASAHNDKVVSDLLSQEALIASGGFCGPPTPYYGLAQIGQAGRPVHDALPTFSVAERGAVTFAKPFAPSQFADAITHWTVADDEGTGTNNDKNCVTIACTPQVTEEIAAFVRCLKIGNFQGRYSPEHVAQAMDFTMQQWASQSEQNLLDRIKSPLNGDGSVATGKKTITVTRVLGATADLLYTIGVAAAGYRNSSRMLPGVGLNVLLPYWVLDMLRDDMTRAHHEYPEQLTITANTINSWLSARGVRASYYYDTPSDGTPQNFPLQNDGPLLDYPDEIQMALFHDGAHVVLDGGPDINFGIVRDSVLNATNDYETFGENFEGYAFLGVKSYWMTMAVCPNGTFSAQEDVSDAVCGGGFAPGS